MSINVFICTEEIIFILYVCVSSVSKSKKIISFFQYWNINMLSSSIVHDLYYLLNRFLSYHTGF